MNSLENGGRVRDILCGALILGLAWAPGAFAQATAPSTTSPAASDAAAELLRQSSLDLAQGDTDKALREVDSAVQMDPLSSAGYEQRGSIYMQKKLWKRAERDYQAALKIEPSSAAFKYKLAEIKFLQKAYDNARPAFAALEKDENLGDLATYRVFLCDLLGGHEDRASADLAAINQVGANPSYYFSNAAWDLYHQKRDEALKWFGSAQRIYDASKCGLYVSSLLEAQTVHPPTVTFVTRDGQKVGPVQAFVEDDGLRVSTSTGWQTIPLAQLPDDLSAFPADMREDIEGVRLASLGALGSLKVLSFVSKKGDHYENVRGTVEDDGLHVLTSVGWILVPFDQLPEDLSPFPLEWRQLIQTKLRPAESPVPTNLVSFTTKQGKSYEQVRWSVSSAGLYVLTADGWVLVSYDQLPSNLSMFPPGVAKQIETKRQFAASGADDSKLLSFTSKRGKEYDQVRWSLDPAGLFVLTSDGWILVPFGDLPDDLSAFPARLREQITEKERNPPPVRHPPAATVPAKA